MRGFAHENPVPAASRTGRHVYSGVLTGRDPDSGEMAEGIDAQMRVVFRHIRELMAAAGGTMDDIVKVTFWLVDYRNREALNREWTAAFPAADSRPARQVMSAVLDRGALVHADLVAILHEEASSAS